MPALYTAPEGNEPPPFWIRGLLILTCTGVSFAHGSNDGQKGMGLIMLILIGAAPTAYALNRALPDSQHASVRRRSRKRLEVIERTARRLRVTGDPRPDGDRRTCTHHKITEARIPSLAVLIKRHRRPGDSNTARSRKMPADKVRTSATTCIWPPRRARPEQGQGQPS